jgi:outer membrane protein assembly factor BamA
LSVVLVVQKYLLMYFSGMRAIFFFIIIFLSSLNLFAEGVYPILHPQEKKTLVERPRDNEGIFNSDTTKQNKKDAWDDFEKENEEDTGIAQDFSDMSSGMKSAVQKHHFTLGEHPYSVQGLPIIYTSKSTGFNLGARLSLTDLKTQNPYSFNLTLQYWVTDRGGKNHQISLDIPQFFSRRWRVRFSYTYPEAIDQNYFGIGNTSIFNKDLVSPGNPNFISRTYYQYKFAYPRFSFDIAYKFLKDRMSIYTGISLDRATIRTINNDGRSKMYTERPYGYRGGKTNYLKLGLKYDTRDYPINPSRGIVLAGTYTDHGAFIGSDYPYSNANLTYMGFFSIWKYFVLAHRVMIDQAWGDTPFFALAGFKSYNDYEGLGGDDTLRGAPTYRYIDNLKFINQLELRTKFYNGKVFGQHLELFVIPYWDMGKVWDRNKKMNLNDIHHSLGGEFRFTWNTTFIASFHMGFSKESFSTGLSFGESFD